MQWQWECPSLGFNRKVENIILFNLLLPYSTIINYKKISILQDFMTLNYKTEIHEICINLQHNKNLKHGMDRTQYLNLSGQMYEEFNIINKISYITETLLFCVGYLMQEIYLDTYNQMTTYTYHTF
jgi:hypothetical protein